MEFEWDPAKDEANQEKHDISFVAATAVFADPALLEEDVTKPEHGETRKKAVGSLTSGWVVAVIYTDRGDRRRIISARRARTYERERYDQGKTSA